MSRTRIPPLTPRMLWLLSSRVMALAIALTSLQLVGVGGVAAAPVKSPQLAASRDSLPGRWLRIDPCQTDRAMMCASTGNGTHVPHLVFVPDHPAASPRLAVFFPGTGGRPSDYLPVGQTLARQGWFVIGLEYTTSIPTESACPNAAYRSDPDCFRRFRAESVFGKNVPDPGGHAYDYAGTHITKADSVMNRLLKLIAYLHAHPALAGTGWGQFLDLHNGTCASYNTTYGACNPDWSRLALGGHSQGAGVALYLSMFYTVDRVAMLSGPEDAYPLATKTVVAPWIVKGRFATPAGRMYGFTHTADPFYRRQTSVWAALGLPGAITRDTSAHLSTNSHRIVTSIAPSCPQFGALAAHLATSVTGCVDLPAYAAVWTAMFGPPSGA